MDEVREQKKLKSSTVELEGDAETLEAFILQLSWVSHRRLEQELETFNLTAPQYIALNCIKEHAQGCSMTELAESSHQVSATMTGIIDRLLDRGLVVRERDPKDRRTLRVGLTPAGKELLERVRERKHAWLLQFLETLTAEERKMMIGMAQRYLAVLEASFKAA